MCVNGSRSIIQVANRNDKDTLEVREDGEEIRQSDRERERNREKW